MFIVLFNKNQIKLEKKSERERAKKNKTKF